MAIAIGSLACAIIEPPITTDRAVIQGKQLELVTADRKCMLHASGDTDSKTFTLEPSPPCHFSRRGGASPQVFEYGDVGVQATLIVIGSPIAPAEQLKWNISPTDTCGSEAQGVIIRRDTVELSEKPKLDGVLCRDKGVDEKNFWYFAH